MQDGVINYTIWQQCLWTCVCVCVCVCVVCVCVCVCVCKGREGVCGGGDTVFYVPAH